MHQYFQLDDLRVLVRGSLSTIGRQILSALIVIEVHARDVVNKILEEEISNVNDFEWISQLRFVYILLSMLFLLSLLFLLSWLIFYYFYEKIVNTFLK